MLNRLNFSQPPTFPELEAEMLAWWKETKAFEHSVSMRPADTKYVFYDGPPFATGLPHYGHLLASTTKDVVPRYWTMKGYRVERVWGWDCHGLPIENMMEQQLEIKGGKKGIEAFGIGAFNQACRQEVLKLDQEWETIISRLGRWVDFEHNYKTMDASFMESVWWGFKTMWEKGLVYEGRKVILYCPRCSTPLSNFEIAMDNSYKEVTEPSTTYKYPVVDQPNTFLLAWSTTPWNKVATPALAVNPTLTYVKVKQDDEFYILAETALSHLTDSPFEIIEKMTGHELEAVTFTLHFDFYPERLPTEKAGVVIADEFVTADEGTGIVTLAVYGEDDYRVMKERQIQLIEHVDEEGRLKAEVTPWAGLSILKVNHLIDQDLMDRNLIYQHQPHTHSVATCYRCSTRLYYAPLPAWFIDIAAIREKLIANNEKINWYPEHLKHGRFMKGLENAPDWNISRSRYWGTPMPIWQATAAPGTDQLESSYRVIGSVAELREWAVAPESLGELTDIHREYLDEVEVWIDDERTIKGRRIPEVFDCWIESGSMPFAVQKYPFENQDTFHQQYPAQFVSEYIAQTRAWFYTMHVISTALFDQPPFENVLTTGTIMAEDGNKMSKSKKNYPDPMVVINTYGVDSLRLYLMSSPIMKGENLNFSEKDVADIRRQVLVIWWNVVSFYHSFAQHPTQVLDTPAKPTHVMDKWLLSRLQTINQEVTQYFDSYDLVRASRTLMSFVHELSTWYLRLSRDRLKHDTTGAVGHVFGHTLAIVAQLFAPLTPFVSDIFYQLLTGTETSVHHTDWPEKAAQHLQQLLETEMEIIKTIVEKGHAQRKTAELKVRQPLAAIEVTINQALSYQAELETVLLAELNIKAVSWKIDADAPTMEVKLDAVITPELKAEGNARDVMRSIQKLRKERGLQPGEAAQVELPEWPEAWQAEIELKTSSSLSHGPELRLLE